MSDPLFDPLDPSQPWQARLDFIVDTMREVSRHTDPHEMVRAYSERMQAITQGRLLSLTRRGVAPPKFLLARDSTWETQQNTWHARDELPVLEGGLLGELVYGNEVRLVQDLEVGDDDPHAERLRGYRSLLAIPVFDGGEAPNVVVFLREAPHAFDPDTVPQHVWLTNLFGRATHNLVLSDELKRAYGRVDREMQLIADIQRSLLPQTLPDIPGLDVAIHYTPAKHAGGDYYDFFPLDRGRWGLLIADVSGHGSPAAVEMAITRTLAHTAAVGDATPAAILDYINRNLVTRIGKTGGAFVTAFCAVYDPAARTLVHASAGHHPPRLKRCSDGSLFSLQCPPAPPLGVVADQTYQGCTRELVEGDQVVLYTDGLVEAFDPDGAMFGAERLDAVLENCGVDANALIGSVVAALDGFRAGREADDDVTMVVVRVTATS